MRIAELRTLITGALCGASKPLSRMAQSNSVPPISSLIRTERRNQKSQQGETGETLTTHATTKFVTLSTISYRYTHDAPSTYPRKWDVASRSTRIAGSADAVVVLARMKLADERVLLVKQYRPPVNAVTLELPAGLIDAGESTEQAALRELREETGFVGSVIRTHPPACMTPGLTDETVVLVEVDVEGTMSEQSCAPGENIEVISVPLSRFGEAVEYIAQAEGAVVMHAVSTLGVGLRMGGMGVK